MLTDRDVVVKVIASGKNPAQTTAGALADQGEVGTIDADDSVEEALRTMGEHTFTPTERNLQTRGGHQRLRDVRLFFQPWREPASGPFRPPANGGFIRVSA